MKDLSLELPNAPQVFFERDAPQIEVSMHNEATRMTQDGLYDVVLTVTVTAKIKDRTVFLVEVAQAGIFQIRNVPPPELDAVLGTLCPNTLLPYAREAVASVVQTRGFPAGHAAAHELRRDLSAAPAAAARRSRRSAAAAPAQTH